MKRIIIFSLFLFGFVGVAVSQQKMNSEEIVRETAKQISMEYDYSPKQQDGIVDILTQRQAEIKKINNSKLGDATAKARQDANLKYEKMLDEYLESNVGKKVIQKQMAIYKESQNK